MPTPTSLADLLSELQQNTSGNISADVLQSLASSYLNIVDDQVSDYAKTILDDASASAAQTTLGLGTAATLSVPASGNASTSQVVKGSDTRLIDSRTPTAHASTHGAAGSDAITIAESQVTNLTTDLAAKLSNPATATLSMGGHSITGVDVLNASGGTILLGSVAGTVSATQFAGGGASITGLAAGNIASGTVPTARLGSGTASSTTYLRGDQSWQTISSGWTGTATSDLTMTTHNITSTTGNMALGQFQARADGSVFAGNVECQQLLNPANDVPYITVDDSGNVALGGTTSVSGDLAANTITASIAYRWDQTLGESDNVAGSLYSNSDNNLHFKDNNSNDSLVLTGFNFANWFSGAGVGSDQIFDGEGDRMVQFVTGTQINLEASTTVNGSLNTSGGGLTVSGGIITGDGSGITNLKTPAVTVVNVSSNVTLTANATHFVSTAAARTLTLPAPSSGMTITIKDSTFQSQTNAITLARHASEKIENTTGSMTLSSNGGYWVFTSNGTDWFLTA